MRNPYGFHPWSKEYRGDAAGGKETRSPGTAILAVGQVTTADPQLVDCVGAVAWDQGGRQTERGQVMSPRRDAPSLIWPGETWHRSFVGRDRSPTRQAEIRASAGSGSIREERDIEKTEGDMEQLSMAQYGKTRSLSCWRIKRLLRRRGYAFELVNVTEDGSLAWLRETTGSEAVPQLFIMGRLVGGFETVRALDRSGDLDRLVRGVV